MKCYPLFSPEDSDLAALAWSTDKDGYARHSIHLSNRPKRTKQHYAHLLVAGRKFKLIEDGQLVDHQNLNKLDNTRKNLRLVTFTGNAQNRGGGAFRGTTLHKCGKWQATVGHAGKTIYLGLFHDRALAAAVALAKRDELGFLDTKPTKQEVQP